MTQENLLARYGILHELGRGATGAVYAARHRETGATVALKRLDPALLAKSGARLAERFLKHARAARLLKHRNIVEIHEAGEAAGTVYVAMEMLEGKSLRKILDEGPLPIARAIQIARDVASGLAHAHLQGVVHGALKPSNVIVLGSGVAKITDFGTGHGGAGYLSPEQLRGEPLDHRSDIFSLGALCYEMLAHRPPSDAKPPPPSELNPHVPHALDAIVLGMLAAQPAARMPGAPIVLRELQRVEEGLGLVSGASAGTGEPKASVPPAAPAARPRRIQPTRLANTSSAEELKPRHQAPEPEAFDYQRAMAMMERESRRERSSGSRPVKLAAFVLAVLGIAVAGVVYISGQWSMAVARAKEALATALETSRPAAPSPVAEATQEIAPAPVAPPPSPPRALDEKQPLKAAAPIAPSPVADATPEAAAPPAAPPPSPAQVENVVAHTPEPPAPPATPPAPKPARTVQAAAKAPEQQPVATARLILAVSPQGELYIDGKHHGTSPPLTTFDIEPGMHRIEVRSGSRTPYLTYMMVQAGDVRRIQHDFDTTHAVHPPASASWRNSTRAAR